MNSSLDLIIVLYNKKIEETGFYPLINTSQEVHNVFIVDNTTDLVIKQHNQNLLKGYSFIIYLDMNGNKGLAKAYNTALQEPLSNYVMILDDDTEISKEEIHNIGKHLSSNKDVYLPVVMAGENLIMSPCNRRGSRFVAVKEIKELRKPFSAINSGIVVRSELFNNYTYDERYFLDMIDHQFIKDMCKRNAQFELMDDVLLRQNYSYITDNKKKALIRFNIYRKDSKVFYSNTLREEIFRIIQLSYRFVRILF